MIIGHENITSELTSEELWLANDMIRFFMNKTKQNPVKSIQIVVGINKHYTLKKRFTDVRLRKIVNYYRVNGILPIISNSTGYYVSYDQKDIEEMIQSLTQRAGSIIDCAFGMKKILLKIEQENK
ncbi:hypothetical protein UFOVP597_36 [uncultured Caudovirales phage]|uniref:Uncharacterized protein n=1 Tax=uncultured Caudovirales phage TaxID=2100421 RepID=A0A6J5N112_9CAUD|nr:hypothetical protein UFOVP597_36 [uncultured Caudovirales phage]